LKFKLNFSEPLEVSVGENNDKLAIELNVFKFQQAFPGLEE